jgi:CHAD domain-containing protein
MADGKWIHDIETATPLADAARRVLTVRLEVVRDYLPRAVHEPEKDPEHVHQLRVGTRRAGAAVEIFVSCLPGKAYKTARKQLKRLRRAAGAARDWDVFLDKLTTWERPVTEKQRPGLDFLTGYAVGQRAAAQERLVAAAEDQPFACDRLVADTVAAVHKPHDHDMQVLVELARPLLSDLLRELRDAVSQDLEDYDHLHRVRIIGKRLRYAMEVFADCFAASFREELYPQVEEMQDILGHANDSHVASQRLEALRDHLRQTRPDDWRRFKPGVEALLRYHQRRLPAERQRFLKWWQQWCDTGGEDVLLGLLNAAAVTAS